MNGKIKADLLEDGHTYAIYRLNIGEAESSL